MIRDARAFNGSFVHCVISNEMEWSIASEVYEWSKTKQKFHMNHSGDSGESRRSESSRTAEKSCGMLATRSKTITNSRHHLLCCVCLCRSFSFDFSQNVISIKFSRNLFNVMKHWKITWQKMFSRMGAERGNVGFPSWKIEKWILIGWSRWLQTLIWVLWYRINKCKENLEI